MSLHIHARFPALRHEDVTIQSLLDTFAELDEKRALLVMQAQQLRAQESPDTGALQRVLEKESKCSRLLVFLGGTIYARFLMLLNGSLGGIVDAQTKRNPDTQAEKVVDLHGPLSDTEKAEANALYREVFSHELPRQGTDEWHTRMALNVLRREAALVRARVSELKVGDEVFKVDSELQPYWGTPQVIGAFGKDKATGVPIAIMKETGKIVPLARLVNKAQMKPIIEKMGRGDAARPKAEEAAGTIERVPQPEPAALTDLKAQWAKEDAAGTPPARSRVCNGRP